MDKLKLKNKYHTEYQSYLIDRFAEGIPDDETDNMNYHIKNQFLFILGAPEDYGIEKDMMIYITNNPEFTIENLLDEFRKIIPCGTNPMICPNEE